MTAGCITFEEVESRAESTVALAIFARRVQEGFWAHAVGVPLLHFLNTKLDDLKLRLSTPFLDKLNDDQMLELSDLLKQLHARLERVVSVSRQSRLDKYKHVKKNLDRIEDSAEDFESIVENIHLAVNPTFHNVVSSAISKLKTEVGESAAMHH